MLARVAQVSTSLITVPLTLRYLGTERFGLWMTISSVLAMAAFADFGIGNGVLNTVSQAFGRDEILQMRKAVSSGFAILCSIALCVSAGFLGIYPFVNWARFLRVYTPTAVAEAGPALAIFAACFALNIALDTVQRVQLGIQQGYRYGVWQMAGSITGLLGVLAGIHFHVGLPALVLSLAGAPTLATLLNALHFFGFVRPDLRPSIALVSSDILGQVARLGLLFFLLQIVVCLAFSADNFIIARTLGASRVPEYAVPQRLFGLISMLSAMMVTPLWPAYGEASTRGDTVWIRRTLFRSLMTVLAFSSVAATTVLLLSHKLLAWWVGGRVTPPWTLLLGLALWSICDCCGSALAMYLNGTSKMRFQIIVALSFGIICLCTKVALTRRFGPAAVPWSTLCTYLLLNALPTALFIPRSLRDLEDQSSLIAAQHVPSAAG